MTTPPLSGVKKIEIGTSLIRKVVGKPGKSGSISHQQVVSEAVSFQMSSSLGGGGVSGGTVTASSNAPPDPGAASLLAGGAPPPVGRSGEEQSARRDRDR